MSKRNTRSRRADRSYHRSGHRTYTLRGDDTFFVWIDTSAGREAIAIRVPAGMVSTRIDVSHTAGFCRGFKPPPAGDE